MFREAVQNRICWLIGASVFLVTVVVTPSSTLDPINVPKLWVLSALAMGLTGVLLTQAKVLFARNNLQVIGVTRSLFVFILVALLASNTYLAQQLFGAYGRNTGLVTYFSFGTFIGSSVEIGVTTTVTRKTVIPRSQLTLVCTASRNMG